MKKTGILTLAILLGFICLNKRSAAQSTQYTMPSEDQPHEGTWLAWPHQYEYGITYRNENDPTWVAMTAALVTSEKVHIIAYNSTEQTRIINLLTAASVSLANVDFVIAQTNDVWARDMAGIFVYNPSANLVMEDWGFNGWGGDYGFAKDNVVPTSMGTALSMTPLDLNNVLTVEGGAYEIDGAGVFLATKTSILTQSNPATPPGIKALRNVGKTQAQAEAVFAQYIGVTKFIWLDGWFSTDDVTDAHVDGFAKFAPGNKLVTMDQADLLYWGMLQPDINTLYAASNTSNVGFTKVYLPLTVNDVKKTDNTSLGYKGSYVNYYVANTCVLVPNYNDPNDAVANSIVQGLYPGRTVVGIDVRNLYGNGGMVHCVTQQQPVATNTGLIENNLNEIRATIFSNPFNFSTTIQLSAAINNGQLTVCNMYGQTVKQIDNLTGQTIILHRDNLPAGLYIIRLTENNKTFAVDKLVITDK